MTPLGHVLAVSAITAAVGALAVAVPAQAAAPAPVAAAAPADDPLAAAAPADDPFYTPPPIPVGAKPGDVLRSRQVPYTSTYPLGGKGTAYQILYVTTNVKNVRIATSGLVVVPTRKATGSPVVAVAHGTTGMGDQCSPSRQLSGAGDAGAGIMQIFVDDAVSRGWVTAAPDYNGLGVPGSHTYSVGIEQGRATLDSARAAQRLTAAKVPAGAKVAIMGYSQGGQSAAAAAEYQPSYAPELNLVGVAAGGVPADMVRMGEFLDGSAGFGFLMMASLGYDTAYPELGMRALLNDQGRQLIGEIDTSCVADVLTKYGGRHISDYTTTNPLTIPRVRAAFVANSLGKAAPKVPVMLYHGIWDQFVPYDGDKALMAAWCTAGGSVKWQDFIGEHVTTALAGQTDALKFIQNRIAGVKAVNNCR